MSYVMVPVPEDRVEDVMQFIVRLMAQASQVEWTEDAVGELFEQIDEPSRALLSTVAMASMAGERLTEGDAASKIELNWRETMGLLREMNDLARDDNHPPLITRRSIVETLPNGRTRDVRILAMTDDLARMVHATDRAHLLREDLPTAPDQP